MPQFWSRWGRPLAGANLVALLILLGIAGWLLLRPGPESSPAAGGGGTAATYPHSRPAGPAPVTRALVFSVAPDYPATLPLSPTQALITGHVVDSATRAPLPGAQLTIDEAGGTLTLHTDAHGRFATPVETARPFGFTVDAAHHAGGVAFGRLCPGERRDIVLALPPAGGPPGAPTAIGSSAC